MTSRIRDVLLVEDDVDLRQAIADVLRDEGCRTYVAADGEEALSILRVLEPDLIVTDLMMPGMNGWDLCARVRADARLRSTPIAVLSAFTDVQPIAGTRMIRKPVDVHALVSLLAVLDDVPRRSEPPPPPR